MRRHLGKTGRADLHIHTIASDGIATIPELLRYVEEQTSLNVIAITDHDVFEGSYEARELAGRGHYNFEVVTGMEVTTLEGHLLALFLEKPVPSYRTLIKTLEAVQAEGGLCIVPHPMSWVAHSLRQGLLDRLLLEQKCGCVGNCLVGIELVNASLANRLSFEKARERNRSHYHLAETGGSDAHFPIQVGTGYTLFPGHTAEDLKRSLLKRQTSAASGARVRLREIGYRLVAKQILRGLVVHPGHLMVKSLRRLFLDISP